MIDQLLVVQELLKAPDELEYRHLLAFRAEDTQEHHSKGTGLGAVD